MTRIPRTYHPLLCAMMLAIATSAHANSECSLRPPRAVLQSNAYADQTLKRQDPNRMKESVTVRRGLRLEVTQSQCEDLITTTFTFVVPRKPGSETGEKYWIDFARTEIGKLRTTDSSTRFSEMNSFLARANTIAPRGGTRSICKDNSAAEAGECSWESLGGFIFEVKHGKSETRVSVTEYTSA
ncbi:MAG: hypothetical protein JWP34_2149 [Massilia sp.]|nr:hypothetical protein [Massilia sp.]